MKILAVDSRITKEILENIKKINKEVLLVEENSLFDKAVCGHPDMNFLQIKDRIFTFSNTNVRYFDTVPIENATIGTLYYPHDVKLNAACIGNDFICRKVSVAREALEYAQKIGLNVINVNQGYVKCNIAVVSEQDKAVITEDEGISAVLNEYGYNVLLLKKHEINLFPYSYGFIGGASGKIGDTLYFTGDVTKHSEYSSIKSFCAKFDVKISSLSKDAMYDYGSIVELDVKK